MPIDLGQLSDATKAGQSYDVLSTVKAFSAKFFSPKLTGVGKKNGILNNMMNPATASPGPTTTENLRAKKTSYVNGQTSVTTIPFYIFSVDEWRRYMDVVKPDKTEMTKIAEMTTNNVTTNIYVEMIPHSIIIEEKTTTTPASQSTGGVAVTRTDRKASVCYQLIFYREGDTASNDYSRAVDAKSLFGPAPGIGFTPDYAVTAGTAILNGFVTAFTCDPVMIFQQHIQLLSGIGYTVDGQAQTDFINNYDLHTAVCKRAEVWQTKLDKVLDDYCANIQARHTNSATSMNSLALLFRHLEDYTVPLDLYRTIYKNVKARFKPDDAKILCKQNLNLLLSDQLNDLHTNKANLTRFTPKQPVQGPTGNPAINYSPEQKSAISTTEPLVLVQAGAGTGKCQKLETPILTPTGWTTMGELKVGDEVIGSDGKPHKVLRIHEKGLRPGYHLTFRDRSATDACGEHLWTVCKLNHGKEYRRTITTEEWINDRKYRNYAYLPIVEPVEYAHGEKDLPLDPYFLGALLADGSLSHGTPRYIKSEEPVWQLVKERSANNGYVMTHIDASSTTADQWSFHHADDGPNYGRLRSTIRNLKLDVTSRNKFIPDIYKTASIEQRKALLNGLFDGDGDVRTGRNYARFNTLSDQLADDVLQLLWSLGLNARKQRQRNKKGDYWSVNLLDSGWDPFIASMYKGKATGTVRPMRRSLVKAEPFAPTPMRCIEVDAPDQLYVTQDFIVTHNSSVILGRIDHMVANGVQPEDITVLSFTNAAADHIKEKNPHVHSMTIASMIHSIYALNFPKQELSSTDTIANALDIYYQNDPLVKAFQTRVKDLGKQDNNSYTAMNNFIEAYQPQVIQILDRIKQTSLELEIILCYQLIDQLQEPPEVLSKFLIIDEVQDNSIFEFIYAIKYVAKHQESLFIVGRH